MIKFVEDRATLESTPIPRIGMEKLCLQFYSFMSNESFGKFYISLNALTDSRAQIEIKEMTQSNPSYLWNLRSYEISTQRLQTNAKLLIDFVVEGDEQREGKSLFLKKK